MKVKKKKGLLLGAMVTSLIATTTGVGKSLVNQSASSNSPSMVIAQGQNLTNTEQQITKAAMEHLAKQVAKQYPPGVDNSNLPDVRIEGITLVRPYALMEWFWGGMGGQALLLNKQRRWQVVLSDYGALTNSYLAQKGVPADIAQVLVRLHQEQSPANATMLAKNVPLELEACIPTRQVARAELAGTTKRTGTTYYLLAVYPKDSEFVTDLLIAVNQQNPCSLLYYNPWGELVSLSKFIPIDAARSLALQRLEKEVKKFGGKTAYQQFFSTEADIPPRRTPEEIWALKQLGFQPRSNIRVVNPNNSKTSAP